MLERIQVKGRDFDKDGKETPKDELLRMPGLFKLKDVEGRIPIEPQRLNYSATSIRNVMHRCNCRRGLHRLASLTLIRSITVLP